MTPDLGRNLAGAAAGLLTVVGPALLVRRGSPRQVSAVAGGGLVVAAAIYPAARRGHRFGAAEGRELAGLGAAAALTAVAARRGGATGNRLLAAGWALHALFDALHHAGERSRIPGWYPAACASYDLTMAGMLLRR